MCKHVYTQKYTFVDIYIDIDGLPFSSVGKESAAMQKTGFDFWVRKIPWRRKWQPIPSFLPGESHGQRSLEGYSTVHGVARAGHDLATKPPHTDIDMWPYNLCY